MVYFHCFLDKCNCSIYFCCKYGKKEENSAPPVGLEPTTSCLHDKGTTTRAKGEPEVVGRGSGSYPVLAALLSRRGQMGEYVSTHTLVIHGALSSFSNKEC